MKPPKRVTRICDIRHHVTPSGELPRAKVDSRLRVCETGDEVCDRFEFVVVAFAL